MMDNSVLPDIPRMYTAMAEWVACMMFILPFKKRFSWWKNIPIMVVFLCGQTMFLAKTNDLSIYFWVPCMIAAVLIMIGFIFCCCDIGLMDASYFGMIAFVVAEFMASLEWQIVVFYWQGNPPSVYVRAFIMIFAYGAISVVLSFMMHKHLPKDGGMRISHKEYISALLIVVAVFAVSNMSYITNNTPFSGSYSFEIGNIRTIVDLGGIAILYAHLIQCCEIRVKRELESVQNVLQNQYTQYKQSRESIELINYKYHDLKHQIEFLKNEKDPDKQTEFLNRMEDEIKQYEAQNKTGNSVLDTVLTSKSLYCAKHDISFTCVADGTLLKFMDVMDICSIFGNALDNAIECELKISDKEKRLIHVSVSKQKAFLLIRFENYYEEKLNYKEGKLVTTKKEKEYHGYGLKSINYTIAKYNGAVSIDTIDNWFDMKILIPLNNVTV